MKAAYQGFASGVAAAILPALQGVVRVATSMLMTLARLVDSIFHTNIVGAIQNAAASYSAAAGGAGKQAKATDKLAKSLKEANRQLMAFDELNVLNAEQEDSNADALGDASDGGGGGGGVDNALLEGTDAGLAQIMIVAGAALIAVGLILCFTGHIAIGATLIAVGALMVYTAVSEQWDKLPQQIQEQLLNILMIVGAVLIVIGIILICTSNIALGIGFIIAGASMFATAAMIDPELMTSMVETFKENILGIVAGALIVIGLILCILGVSLPVGIALIAAGALLMIGEVALNGDEMPEQMRGFIETALDIIGKALIVVGFMLILTAQIPLGIGAIVAGIAILAVKEMALNGDEMKNNIEGFVAKIIPILAGALIVIGIMLLFGGVTIALGIACIIAGITVLAVAEEKLNEDFIPDEVENFMDGLLAFIKENAEFLLVIGIILCFGGVTLGLGIACIIAGIAGIVMPEDFDFDALKEKIGEVWDGIVSWWNDNVANIFTAEFWEGVFQSIADGLWGALSSAGEAINGFFSDIGGGIADIASTIGIDLSFAIPQVDIPFLASGAVIPPNRSFMAVLGDQSNGRNLEAPEGLIRQIVREESGGAGGAEMLSVLYSMLDAIREGSTIYADGEVLGRIAQRNISTMERMGGY